MSIRFASLFAALALAISLHAPNAAAQLSVMATQASGVRGQNVDVTLTVGGGGPADEVDLSQISAYTFNLLWDATALDFNSLSTTANLGAATLTSGAGSAVLDWYDVFSFADLSGGLSITANFHIRNDAAFGATAIAFGDSLGSSVLFDGSFASFEFSGVTQGNGMQVTVLPSVAPIPEPAEVSMLLAGLGVLAAVVRRRRNRQA